jgi:hypothetical protein
MNPRVKRASPSEEAEALLALLGDRRGCWISGPLRVGKTRLRDALRRSLATATGKDDMPLAIAELDGAKVRAESPVAAAEELVSQAVKAHTDDSRPGDASEILQRLERFDVLIVDHAESFLRTKFGEFFLNALLGALAKGKRRVFVFSRVALPEFRARLRAAAPKRADALAEIPRDRWQEVELHDPTTEELLAAKSFDAPLERLGCVCAVTHGHPAMTEALLRVTRDDALAPPFELRLVRKLLAERPIYLDELRTAVRGYLGDSGADEKAADERRTKLLELETALAGGEDAPAQLAPAARDALLDAGAILAEDDGPVWRNVAYEIATRAAVNTLLVELEKTTRELGEQKLGQASTKVDKATKDANRAGAFALVFMLGTMATGVTALVYRDRATRADQQTQSVLAAAEKSKQEFETAAVDQKALLEKLRDQQKQADADLKEKTKVAYDLRSQATALEEKLKSDRSMNVEARAKLITDLTEKQRRANEAENLAAQALGALDAAAHRVKAAQEAEKNAQDQAAQLARDISDFKAKAAKDAAEIRTALQAETDLRKKCEERLATTEKDRLTQRQDAKASAKELEDCKTQRERYAQDLKNCVPPESAEQRPPLR